MNRLLEKLRWWRLRRQYRRAALVQQRQPGQVRRWGR